MVISFVLAVVLTLTALRYLPVPYLWISLGWFSCAVVFTMMASKGSWKLICLNLACAFLLFGFIEAVCWIWVSDSADGITHSRAVGYFSPDEALGYAPVKGRTVKSSAYKDNDILYNVTYTIGDNGLRISAPSQSTECVLFFGDSFTFGEGVEDHEAMPYVVGQMSGFKVFNFGFHGYGPHQMLSALQHGVVERLVDCVPRTAVYQAILHHAARAAGLSSWDKHGPKYVLSGEILKFDGHFDDHSRPRRTDASYLVARVEEEINKSFIHKYFSNRERAINNKDLKLFLEIIDASRKTITTMYPGLAFHVIFWNEPANYKYNGMVEEGLRKRHIDLHLITSILPEFSAQRSMYEIPIDRHPNALAHAYIAQYVVEKILRGGNREPPVDFATIAPGEQTSPAERLLGLPDGRRLWAD